MGQTMDWDAYAKYISEGKIIKAEALRIASMPAVLTKFYSLNGSSEADQLDEQKIETLKDGRIWLSNIGAFNDPYEFNNLILDEYDLQKRGYSQESIDEYQELLRPNNFAVCCLTSNDVHYLPMWAYYTNNYRGFAVEYETLTPYPIRPYPIHEVLYKEHKVPINRHLDDVVSAVKRAIQNNDLTQARVYTRALLLNLYIKSKTWEHEAEYRIVQPMDIVDVNDTSSGVSLDIDRCQLKIRNIYAGFRCSGKNRRRLYDAAIANGLDGIYVVGAGTNEDYHLEYDSYYLYTRH